MAKDSPGNSRGNKRSPSTTNPPFITQDEFPVERYRVVGPDGGYDPAAVPNLTDDEFLELFEWMLRERIVNGRLIQLQRRGELGTMASGRGQEASIVGAGYTLEEPDWLFVGRGWTPLFMKGASMSDIILFWRGIEDAAQHFAEHNCMITISIGSQLPIINGVGWGMSLTDTDAVAVTYFGDGAASTGAAHEGINFAGVLGSPVLFFCQNNQYAISTPFEKQTNARTLAQRALGYGVPGIRVDGNDVLAVYNAVSSARQRVKEGEPVFVESVTYRRDAHTTSDDPKRYRDEEEVESWKQRDPIDRYRQFLEREGLWEDVDEENLRESIEKEFDQALDVANNFERRCVNTLFTHLYEELPASLKRQYDEIEQFFETHPDALDYIDQRPKG